MATTSDIRNGLVIDRDGELWEIIEFLHVKPGKGSAFVRTKQKNVRNGKIVDHKFRSGENLETVRLEDKKMQFLYSDGENYHFMDQESFEQTHLPEFIVGDKIKYMKEGEIVDVLFYGNEALSMTLPNFVILEVTETNMVSKSDTASGSGKPATTETGAVVTVPVFLNVGDKIRIDTRTNTYIERA